MAKKINIKSVLTRDICRKSLKFPTTISMSVEEAFLDLESTNSNFNNIETFFRKCMSFQPANENYINCLKILSELSSTNYNNYDNLLDQYSEFIMPYVEDINSIKESRYLNNIKGKEKILESIENMRHSDRLLSNFDKINKKHNVLEMIEEDIASHYELSEILENVYDIINTYDINRGPKLNLTLETSIYCLEKLGYNYDNKYVVDTIADMFLSESYTAKDYNSFLSILRNNVFIQESDSLKLLESEEYADSNDVKDLLNNYKKIKDKDENTLKKLINKIYTKSPKNIIDETPNILGAIRKYGLISVTLSIHPVLALVAFCTDKFIEMHLNENESKKILNYFKSEKKKTEKKISSCRNEKKKENLEKYNKSLDRCIEKIEEYISDISSDENIKDVLDDIEEASNVPDYMCQSHDQYISYRFNDAVSEMNTVVQMLSNVLYLIPELDVYKIEECIKEFSDYNNIHRFLTPGNKQLIQVPIFKISNTIENLDQIYKEISKLCSKVNTQLNGYVTLVEKCVDSVIILFMDLSPIDSLCNDDSEEINESFKLILSELYSTMDIINNPINEKSLIESIIRKLDDCNDIDEATVLTILADDILQFNTTNLEESFINALEDYYTERCDDKFKFYNDTDYYTIINRKYDKNRIYNELNTVENIEEFVECCKLTQEVLNEDVEVKDVKKKVVEKKEKKNNEKENNKKTKEKGNMTIGQKISDKTSNIKKGISNKTAPIKQVVSDKKEKLGKSIDKFMNNGELAIQAFKKDLKDLSDKEREASRNIDITFNGVKRGMEKALTSNKRESIINGSIIPSFSKMMKTAITFAGTYAFMGPAVAVIGGLGAFALSKSLTNKERQLILDEIEVELQVVEKEIAQAEDDKDTKRYRQLLTYQRKLEREYQRIHYNVKVFSKEVIPVIKKN